MSRASVQLAHEDLEPALARFASSSFTEGTIRLRLDCPNGYINGLTAGTGDVVAAVRDDAVVGTAALAVRRAYPFPDAPAEPIGVIGNVRIAPEKRSSLLFARGLELLRERCEAHSCRMFLAVVQHDNTTMLDLLRSGRRVLPFFRDRGRLFTLILRGETDRGCVSGSLVTEVSDFLARPEGRPQYFPELDNDTFGGSNVISVQGPNGPRAVARVVDTSVERRWVVAGYSAPLRHFRGLYNWVALRRSRLPLPPPGSAVPYRAVSMIRAEDGEAAAALFRRRTPHASSAWLTICLHERSALLPALRPLAAFVFESRLFDGAWERSTELPPEDELPYMDASYV